MGFLFSRTIGLIIFSLLFLSGCAGSGARRVYRPIELAYTPRDIQKSDKNNITINLVKPETSKLPKISVSQLRQNYPGIQVLIMRPDGLGVPLENDELVEGKISLGLSAGFAYPVHDLSAFIIGALGSELKSFGYDVRYLNQQNNYNHEIILGINKLDGSITRNGCIGSINIDFIVYDSGSIINKFNVTNDKYFPDHSDVMNYANFGNCTPIAIKCTLEEVFGKATSIINDLIR